MHIAFALCGSLAIVAVGALLKICSDAFDADSLRVR